MSIWNTKWQFLRWLWHLTSKRPHTRAHAHTHTHTHTHAHTHIHTHAHAHTGIVCRACHLSGTFFHCDTSTHALAHHTKIRSNTQTCTRVQFLTSHDALVSLLNFSVDTWSTLQLSGCLKSFSSACLVLALLGPRGECELSIPVMSWEFWPRKGTEWGEEVGVWHGRKRWQCVLSRSWAVKDTAILQIFGVVLCSVFRVVRGFRN